MPTAVEQIYEAFADIPQRQSVNGCTHCCTTEDILRELTKDSKKADRNAVSNLAHNAMSTVGNEGDFSYFLPRIFDEMISDKNFWHLAACSFLERLQRAGYESWSSSKQKCVDQCLKLYLSKFIEEDEVDEVVHWLAAASKTDFNLVPLFELLDTPENATFKELLIQEYIVSPVYKWPAKDVIVLDIYELTQDQFLKLEVWAFS